MLHATETRISSGLKGHLACLQNLPTYITSYMNDCQRVYVVYMKQTFTVNVQVLSLDFIMELAACSLTLHLDLPLESTTMALNCKW